MIPKPVKIEPVANQKKNNNSFPADRNKIVNNKIGEQKGAKNKPK